MAKSMSKSTFSPLLTLSRVDFPTPAAAVNLVLMFSSVSLGFVDFNDGLEGGLKS